MNNLALHLPLIWAVLLSIVILTYVVLDGFDLGIGILFPFFKETSQRDIMISTIVPVWDGNETWLVMGAAFLYSAFPLAYSTLLPTLYVPIMIMLAALVFRGVALEFRFKAQRSKVIWDIAFAIGSTLAALCQGIILGTFVLGYQVSHPTSYAWLTPFSMMTGIAVIAGYALLGATWLIGKTTRELQAKLYQAAKLLLLAVAFFMLLVSLWTPLASPAIWQRWFVSPGILWLAPLPLVTIGLFIWNWFSLKHRAEKQPFVLSILLFIFAYLGFCISDFPYIIPRVITIWEAASPVSSQLFLLVGACMLIPLLLGYTIYSYRTFRGKVTSAEHHY